MLRRSGLRSFNTSPLSNRGMSSRSSIRKIGRVGAYRMERRKKWIADNPPDENGGYDCHICVYFDVPKALCFVKLENMALDHEIPKGSGKDTKYIESDENLKPSHRDCNLLKGSQLLCQMAGSARSIQKRGI